MADQPVPYDRVIVGYEDCRSHQIDPWAKPPIAHDAPNDYTTALSEERRAAGRR
jgi:hypothetical protein